MPENATAARTVYRIAALFTFLAVVMGAVVAATKSGASCPNWPGCRVSHLSPQWQLNPVVEFSHRVVAVSSGPLILLAGVMAARTKGAGRWVRIFPWIALVGAFLSGVFGRMVIVSTLPTPLAGVDLFAALTAMTLMAMGAVCVGRRPGTIRVGRDLLDRLALACVAALVALHVSAIFVAGTGSFTGTIGWPLHRLVTGDLHPWLQTTRLVLAAVAAVLVVATAVLAVRDRRLVRWDVAIGVLAVLELVFGLVIRSVGLNNADATAYAVTAVALLWTLGLLVAVAGAPRVVDVTEGATGEGADAGTQGRPEALSAR
jgi:heme a synthase